jgi:hypothetical protein
MTMMNGHRLIDEAWYEPEGYRPAKRDEWYVNWPWDGELRRAVFGTVESVLVLRYVGPTTPACRNCLAELKARVKKLEEGR